LWSFFVEIVKILLGKDGIQSMWLEPENISYSCSTLLYVLLYVFVFGYLSQLCYCYILHCYYSKFIYAW